MTIELPPGREGERLVSGHAGNAPGHGPFMRVHLTVSGGVVREASYETYQCPACHDCGKAICALVKGQTLEAAAAINRDAVAARVGPLPRAKAICYSLAVLALADTLRQLTSESESVADLEEHRVSGHSGNAPGQGPFMDVILRVAAGVILEASYETYNCPGCHACGKAIVAMVAGKSVTDARAIKYDHVVNQVGPLSRHRQVCYGLALLALSGALDQLKPS